MAYIIPQALIYQELTSLPSALTDPLRACLVGPNATLFRYAQDTEKAQSALGSYNYYADAGYSYPARPTGGIVDQSYFKLWGDDVLLRYFEDAIGADSTIAPVAGYSNRIRSTTVNWKANTFGGTTYARAADLYDRDVAVGDIVDIRASVLGTEYSLRSTVVGFQGDIIADVIDAATADAGNDGTQIADCSLSQTVGPHNCLEAAADCGLYDGTADGDINEIYTITVTQGSADGDLTTAFLSVRSASGNDDEDDVAPSVSGVATDIGARGLLVTFDNTTNSSCSASAGAAGISEDDLIAGQKWVVTVQQAYTAPTVTSGGDYTGTYDTTYIITVTRGGAFTDTLKPQITVSTTHGVDYSGPTDVAANGTAYASGSYGVTITFSGAGVTNLNKDDVFYITVTAEGQGPIRALILGHNLSSQLLTAVDLHVKLYISKTDVEIPAQRTGSPGVYNYVLGDAGILDTGFTVNAGITAYDSTWTNGGVEMALPMVEADLYAEYRAWICDAGNAIYSISDSGDIDEIPGVLHPDNPLKWAVYMALQNSNGTAVKYCAVCNPDDTTDWTDVLELLQGRKDVYGIVPLTRDVTILGLYQAHVASQSSAENGCWRTMWISLYQAPTKAVVDSSSSSDSNPVLAIVGDDPDIVGDQWVIVEVPAGNGDFVTNAVASGDIMRYNYTTDGWGSVTYDELVIDTVINEDTLRLRTGQGTVQVLAAKKLEIWRTLTPTQLSAEIADSCAVWDNRRVRCVWPDTASWGDNSFAGYHVCAALAGLRSGVPPNQGMTNLSVSGIDDVSRTVDLFGKSQLDTMAESGVWILTKDDDSNIVTRHALTSDGYGAVLTQEEMVTSNVDSISYVMLTQVEDLIGQFSVTPTVLDLIELRLEGAIEFLKEIRVERLGGQITEATIEDVRQHAIMKDRVVVEIEVFVPVPLNNISVYLQIVA